MTKNLLFIAYVFPPMAYVGNYRTARFCKHLSRAGHKVTVLTIKEQPDLRRDHNLLEKVTHENIKIVRTSTFDPWRKYRKIKDKVISHPLGRLVNKVLSVIFHFVNQPDHMIFWVPFAVFKGRALLKTDRFDVIYTSSPPHSEQITGYLLKKITGVPWIADLRDPIVNNVLNDRWSLYEKFVNTHLEKIIVEHADAIIVNTFQEKKEMEKRYEAKNVYVIRNSFDEDDYRNLPADKFEKFTVAHIGSFYYANAEILLNAIKKLDERKLISHEDFRVLFVGIIDRQFRQETESNGLGKYFEFKDLVPHEEAIKIMAKSHVLLLIKGFNRHSGGHIPAKLYEYIASRNRILCIGPKESEAAHIIHELDAGTVVGKSAEELCVALGTEFEAFTKNLQQPLACRDIIDFSSGSMTNRFLDVLSGL